MKLRTLAPAAALVALAASAAPAAAQTYVPTAAGDDARLAPTRFALTPWIGLRPSMNVGDAFLFRTGEDISALSVEREREDAPVVGVDLQVGFTPSWGVVGGVAYSPERDEIVTFESTDGTDVLPAGFDGPDMLLAKAALQYRLPEPDPDLRRFHPAGYLYAGPSLVRLGFDDESSVHFGANLGAAAEVRLGRGLALNLGLDDYVTFWDNEELRQRDEVLLSAAVGEPVVVDYDYDFSNMLILRAGLSLRR